MLEIKVDMIYDQQKYLILIYANVVIEKLIHKFRHMYMIIKTKEKVIITIK